MRFKIIKKQFLEALSLVGNAVDAKANTEIEKCFLVETVGQAIAITGTDLTIAINASLDCEVNEPGKACFPADKLMSFVSALQDGVVEFSCDKKFRATITSGRRTYKLAGMPADDFPHFKVSNGTPTRISFPSCNTLHEMISSVASAASTDDTRRSLKGVCVNVDGKVVNAVATDGRRCAVATRTVADLPDGVDSEAIIPSSSIRVLRTVLGRGGIEPVDVTVFGNSIRFLTGRTMFTTRIVDDRYPNFRQVIPRAWSGKFTVDVGELVDEIKSCAVASVKMDKDDKIRAIFMAIADGEIHLVANSGDIAESSTSIPVKFDGEFEATFNPDYLVDALTGAGCKEVEVRINGDYNPIGIYSRDGESYICVLMPLRINR